MVERLSHEQVSQKKIEMETRMERMAQRMEKQRRILGVLLPSGVVLSGKDKAKAIRAASKGKSKTEKLAEAAADLAKEVAETEIPATPPAAPPTTPPPTTQTT